MMMAMRAARPMAASVASMRTLATTSVRSMGTFYTKKHEWISVDGGNATVGITDYAQDAMGDLVYVELPDAGDELEAGESFASVESVKAVSEVYSPIDGEVTETNESLDATPGLVNTAPETDGWLIKMTVADESQLDSLLDEAAYRAYLEEQA